MKINKNILAVTANLLVLDASAAAFQLNEHSATGLGRAFAGEGAIADNAAVLARNPAAMSMFEQAEISVLATAIFPDVSLEGVSAPQGIDAETLNLSSIAPDAFIPSIYYIQPINHELAIGFGVFSNFGLSTKLPEDYAAGLLGGETSLTTVNFNGSVSYKINEKLSLGAGLNLVYGDAELSRNLGANQFNLPNATIAANMTGDDYGFGWNIGALYEINAQNRISLSYRSQVDLTLTGDYSNDLPIALGGLEGQVLAGDLAIALPDIAELSGFHQLSDKFAIHYSVMWTGWSSFEKLEAFAQGIDDPVFSKEENFENSTRSSLGVSYDFDEAITFRAGIAYDETPVQQAYRSISIPDSNRVWYSTGFSYRFKNASSADFGFSYVKGQEETFTETDDFGQQWQFNSSGDALIMSAQYNYRF